MPGPLTDGIIFKELGSAPTAPASSEAVLYAFAGGFRLRRAAGNPLTLLTAGSTVSATAPSSPVEGQLWYDSDDGSLWIWDGSTWVEVTTPSGGGAFISDTAPSSPTAGMLWLDTDDDTLYVYDGAGWVAVGGGGSGSIVVSDTAPGSPATGTLWYESDTGLLSVWDGSVWVELTSEPGDGGAVVQSAAPSSPYQGQLWLDTDTDVLSVWDGTGWVAISGDPTMGGDLTGTASNAQLAADTVGLTELSATGTPSSSTFLRGDNTWAAPAGGGGDPWGIIRTFDPGLATGHGGNEPGSWAVYLRTIGGSATITKVGLSVTQSAGAISVAQFSNTGSGRSATPGTRNATSGSVSCPAAGYAEVDLGASVAHADGDWLALSASFDTSKFGQADGNTYRTTHGALTAGRAYLVTSSPHPIPSTPTLINGTKAVILLGIP